MKGKWTQELIEALNGLKEWKKRLPRVLWENEYNPFACPSSKNSKRTFL